MLPQNALACLRLEAERFKVLRQPAGPRLSVDVTSTFPRLTVDPTALWLVEEGFSTIVTLKGKPVTTSCVANVSLHLCFADFGFDPFLISPQITIISAESGFQGETQPA
jgi:hypothetical protein